MKSDIRISKLVVENLFNTFDHSIEFKHAEGITLLLGQNGLGKTMILKIIQSIIEGNFIFLETIQFSLIKIEFLNKICWEIKREFIDDQEDLVIRNIEGEEIVDEISISKISKNSEILIRLIRRHSPDPIRQIDDDTWFNRRTEGRYSTKELLNKYKKFVPKDKLKKHLVYPDWVSNVYENQNISLIETQRLLTLTREEDYRGYRRSHINYVNTVEEYSEHISSEIKLQLSSASELATKLDRTYPNRLIERLKNTSSLNQSELNNKLKNLEKKRTRLQNVGLLDLEKESNIKNIQEQDEAIKEVLLVYIEDSQNKLEAYDDFADRIELFLKIINSKFLKKRLSISKEGGFNLISTKTKEVIPVESLSSGEQHLLVLYYKLLFKIKEGTVLLMDEPEISLHISWQKHIISDLKDILKLNQMDVIIATHSPSVIGNNWNLTVELEA